MAKKDKKQKSISNPYVGLIVYLLAVLVIYLDRMS